jgi:hypothetical protein
VRRLLFVLAAGLTGLSLLGGSSASTTSTTKIVQLHWHEKQLRPRRSHISSGDSLHMCNDDVWYNQAFAPLGKYNHFSSPRIAPGKCWTSPKLVNREPHQIVVKIFDEIHSQSKAWVYIAPKGNPSGFTIGLTVNDNTPPVGGTVKFTATLNKTVIGTPYSVRIRDLKSQYVVQACGSQVTLGRTGKVCRGEISWDKAESYTFKAFVEERNDEDHVVASSGPVAVHWGG